MITILKGKLLKGDRVEIEYTSQDNVNAKPVSGTLSSDNPPRSELKSSFGNLAIHAALLGEFIAPVMVPDIDNVNPDLVKDYTVTGFTITGKDDNEGVILSAQKKLKNDKSLGFNTPITRFQDESPNAYTFIDDLIDCIDDCRAAMKEYLSGKYAADPQQALPFNNPDETR